MRSRKPRNLTKFNFKSNLHQLACKDSFRPDMGHIYFKDGYMWVTDAHILLKQSIDHSSIIDPEHLEGKNIHHSIYQMIKGKFQYVTATPEGLSCKDLFGNKVMFSYSISSTPDFADNMKSVIPTGKPVEVNEIGMNLNIINRLRKGMVMSNMGCKFEFFGKNKAILVTANGIENQTGLIMPVMIND